VCANGGATTARAAAVIEGGVAHRSSESSV
jgi:hypothetical protein